MRKLVQNYKLQKQLKQIESSQHPDIAHFLSKEIPDATTRVFEAEYLALDFETTGLNAQKHDILSIGYTVLRGSQIILGLSDHHIIQIDNLVSSRSATIHGISDTDARQGTALEHIMPLLLEQLAGRFVLVHHEPIEKNFLAAACKKIYGFALPLQFVDTLQIERALLRREQSVTQPNQLRLFNLRRQYGLPRYNAHNAMEDAIATAELFLAQSSKRIEGKPNLCVADMMP